MNSEPQSPTDEELVRQCREGALPAFEGLVSRHEGSIYRFAQSLCRNEADAREVAQDTFVRAYQALGQYQTGRSFSAWLFGIARRKCIDRLRTRRTSATEAVAEAVDDNDPSISLMRQEEQQNIWELARRELSASHYEVLWLRFVQELSVTEIAEVTRRTQTHVKVILFRARTRMSEALEKFAGGEAKAQPAVRLASSLKRAGAVNL